MQKYTKIFVSSDADCPANGQPYLQNGEPMIEDVNQKIDVLINAKDDDERHKIKIDILREFNEIYKHDCKTAQWPCGEEYGVTDKERKNKILKQDLGLYLGNIFTFFHKEYMLKKGIPMLWSDTFVDYSELYWHAANDYFAKLTGTPVPTYVKIRREKQAGNPSTTDIETKYATTTKVYLAAFVLPALIESRLDIHLKNKILDGILVRIQEKDISKLNDEQKNLLQVFRENTNRTLTFVEPRENLLGKLWSVFCQLKVVDNKVDKESKEIIQSGTTSLKNILETTYMKSHILPEYQLLFRWLFDADNLNLRNITMHGANVSFNNFSIKLCAILLQLFWDICAQEIYRKA